MRAWLFGGAWVLAFALARAAAASDHALEVAAAEPLPSATRAPVLSPMCFAVTGAWCRHTIAFDVGLGAGANLHGSDLQAVARGFTGLGYRAAIGPVRLGPLVDVGFEVSGNERDDKAVGWYVLPRASMLVPWSERWAVTAAAGPSFVRTFHDLGIDTGAGFVVEGGVVFGQASFTLAMEPLFDPGGSGSAQLRGYLVLRGSMCGLVSAMTYGRIDC